MVIKHVGCQHSRHPCFTGKRGIFRGSFSRFSPKVSLCKLHKNTINKPDRFISDGRISLKRSQRDCCFLSGRQSSYWGGGGGCCFSSCIFPMCLQQASTCRCLTHVCVTTPPWKSWWRWLKKMVQTLYSQRINNFPSKVRNKKPASHLKWKDV